MNKIQEFLIGANGLFDFDLTFPAQTILFLFLSFVITNVFLNPISKQLTERSEFLNSTLKKSWFVLNLGYEELDTTIKFLSEDIDEKTRELKLVKEYTTNIFDEEIYTIQKESLKVLTELKGQLAIKSVYLFANFLPDIHSNVDDFFLKKFKSN